MVRPSIETVKTNWYPTNRKINLRNMVNPKALYIYSCAPPSGRRVMTGLLHSSLDMLFSWYPHDMLVSDCRKFTRRMNPEGIVKMAKKQQFVYNNLSKDELKILDKEYPTVDTVDEWFQQGIAEGMNFAIRAEQNGGFIAFCNQGEYATTGRSSTPFDAVVIVLFKARQCGWQLSSAATERANNLRG